MAVGAKELGSSPAIPAAKVMRPRTPRLPVDLLLLLLAAALFLGYASRTITAPFGDSHDGRNAGVWATGSQSLREDGPVSSRLGTRSPEGGIYANHPPLIYVETAVAELLGSSATAATRAPAWLGSLLALWLLLRLLRECELVRGAAGTAVILAATTPMFLVYGTMLDTPVTSLPIGLALLLVWERARRGAVRPVLGGVLAALAVLSGWQGLLLALLLGTWAAVRVVRGRGRSGEVAFPAGALLGAALLAAWLLWAIGFTVRPLVDQFRFRTGQSIQRVSLGELLAAHGDYAAALYGVVGTLGLVGLVLALHDRRSRGMAAVSVGATLPYAMVFRSGAANHDYWDYWFLLPLALGLAVGADRLLTYWSARHRPLNAALMCVALMAGLLAASAWSTPPDAEALKINGFEAAEVLRASPFGPDQKTAWYAGAVVEPASWLALATGRPAVLVRGANYGSLAASAADDAVMVGELHCVAGADVLTYEIRSVASLVDRPPALDFCESRRPAQLEREAGR